MSEEEFVTVVSVEDAPYVTVVEVQEPLIRTTGTEETSAVSPPLQEDIHIYRLPGERLGFGLKFDGGPTVSSLTVESTAEGSPSARARASWGPLAPGDCILAVDNRPVAEMSRQEVVTRLTESGLVVKLRVRRGPPPVPPRRHCKPRLAGPPPPPRPLPRAPPRLVDFLPKDSSRPPEVLPSELNEFKYAMSEMQQETDTTDEKGLYQEQRTNTDPQTDRIQLEDDLKEKIIPLKNLNPKLISLFEHWQPTDNIIKTSQNLQLNNKNKFCLNDDKSRKSIKDKIALFSSEVETNSDSKPKKLELNEQNEASKKLQMIGETASFLEAEIGSNYNLCNRINVNESCDIINDKDYSNIVSNMDLKSSFVPINSGKNEGMPVGEDSVVSLSVNSFQSSNSMQSQYKENTEDTRGKNDIVKEEIKVTSVNPKVSSTASLVTEPRKKSLVSKEKTSTKLRGLVIPRTPSKIPSTEQIFDLPEIKSSALLAQTELFDSSSASTKQDELSNVVYNGLPHLNQKCPSTVTAVKPSLEWKPNFENELPKYSPAFKRKALTVFEIKSNFSENNAANENDLSQTKLGSALFLPLNSQDESKLQRDTTFKENEQKYETTVEDLEHSSLTSVDPEEQKATVESSFMAKGSSKKDVNYLVDSGVSAKDNNAEPNSLTSHNSLSFNITEHDKSKQFRDGKLDSLLSQDMSDSGNHSIPSICSKSKYDSSDESISSLGNSDSDHVSLDSSSEEGQFIEFNYNESKNEAYQSAEDDKSSKPFTRCSNGLNETKTLVDSLLPVTSVDNDEAENIKEQVTALKKELSAVDGVDENTAFLKNIPKEYPENEFPLKVSLNEKINPSTLSQYKQLEMKEYNCDSLSKDAIIEENISSLSSPIGDLQKDNHFASITSLASSTSLISHQELCQLIEESNDSSLDDSSGTRDISVIVLHRDSAEGSIGITLAGGIDYECKDIMVHKVLCGSPADKDGRIKKGHRILSINGKSMKGLTHLESLAVLKAPRHEVVLVVARPQGYLFEENNNVPKNSSQHSVELSAIPATSYQSAEEPENKWGPVVTVTLMKEGAGLGFSLKGGKDSPTGDQPLTVQKIFTGGCAEKSKQIFAGDELLSINQYDLNGMTRVETWTLMKRLPDGLVTLKLRHSAH